MRVAIWPSFSEKEQGNGGIRRVWEALHKWLPYHGVEIVEHLQDADVVNVHADRIKTDKPVAYFNHGLYWSGYEWPDWALKANAKLVQAVRYSHSLAVPSEFVHNVFARGMRRDPFVLHHGIEFDEWEPQENHGYVVWAKTRIDSVCSPAPVNQLAKLCSGVPFVSTFGNRDLPNLTLTGHMTYERSRSVISHAAVYLATVCETGGITVLEAMASGIPALGWDHGVNRELIKHKETGWLAPVGDYNALKEGLYYVLNNREELGANAREYVRQNHQWQDRIGDYIPFFQAAIDNAQPHQGPKVSIIVTAYNLAKYLPACLDSIQSQSFKDWECVIVEDHSPDNCLKIAKDYAKRDPRFRVIANSQNYYLAEARNIGIRSALGQYILPLDADDELGPETLAILTSALDQDPEKDVVFGGFELIEPDGKRWVSPWPPENPTYAEQIKGHNQLPYSSMYRRECWERVGGYKRRWYSAEDAAFWTEIMSYGANAAKVTQKPTLVYNNRPNSMSHTIPTPDWTAWTVWAKVPELTPFGASGNYERPIHSYDPPLISIVIPCGPNHDQYLPDAIDSCLAQTVQNLEIICVNDTGIPWVREGKVVNPYLMGYPFVKIIDCEEEGISHGPAHARNRGITLSHAPLFLLLDADDYLQPLAAELMLKAYKEYGGWIYSNFTDQNGEVKTLPDFDWNQALIKMPGAITGLYAKADWEAVGGFDEQMVYWEDYSFLLSLMELGHQGVLLRYPAFTYRYNLGTRREWTHVHAKEALAEIKKKHPKLYK